jgi:hypothetical protein
MNDLPQARMLTRKKLGGFVMSYYRHWGFLRRGIVDLSAGCKHWHLKGLVAMRTSSFWEFL